MTREKSFKRVVRARMEKTGESYTAARASLLAADEPKATEGPTLSVSDPVILDRTGRSWEEWFDVLDEWGAPGRSSTEVRAWLAEEHGVDSWGTAAVAINYQRARGLRAVGEHADGFTITASRTVAVPVERLYDAFADASLRERTATRPKSARFDWGGGDTRVNVTFLDKGEGKSSLALSHERLPDADEAERMKAYWRERLADLKAELEGGAVDA